MLEQIRILEIKKLLRYLGIPVNLMGYKYIAESVHMMLNSEKTIFLVEIYQNISNKYSVSVESVEISIRHAIKKSVKNNKNIRNIMSIPEDVSISNSIFLSTVKELMLEAIDLL